MTPKVTILRKANASFPENNSEGDIVVNCRNELFVFANNTWNLIGGRFIDPDILFSKVLAYLKTGWAKSSVLREDLENILLPELCAADPPREKKYEFNSPHWYSLLVKNILNTSDKLYAGSR